MWFAILLLSALAASAVWLKFESARARFRLGLLSLMLWGATIMVAVDRFVSYLEGGQFMEGTTDGLVENSALLGVAMLVPIILIWAVAVFLRAREGKNRRAANS